MIDRDIEVNFRKNILIELSKQGVSVRANFNYINDKIAINEIDKVYYIKLRQKGILGKILLNIEQQITLIKNLDADVVVLRPFNLIESLPIWFFWKKILGRKLPKFVLDIRSIVTDDPVYIKHLQRKMRFWFSVKFAFCYFDGLTMITKIMKKDIQNVVNNFNKKIGIWSSGVNPDMFDPEKAIDISDKLKINNRFVIMYHGVFSFQRGLQQAIKAIKIVKKYHPEVLFLLLGKGRAKAELEKLINNLNLQNNIMIHDAVSYEHVPDYIKSAKVGLLPFPDIHAWNTSSPIKLTEYLSMGKPVIVTDIEAHREALGNLKCGIFVKDHQPENIAKGIFKIINSRSELHELGKIARSAALEKFTLEQQALKIKKFFNELLNE